MNSIQSIFDKKNFIKPIWQSLFCAFITTATFLLTDLFNFGHLAGYTVVITISITSINTHARLKQKINIMVYTLGIYTICIFLGFLAGRHVGFILPCFVLISWIIAKVKQHIPELWGDIVLPAGLAIYLAFNQKTLWDIELANLLAGILAILIHIVFIAVCPQKWMEQQKKLVKKHHISLNKLGLNPILTTYFIQLSILLCINTFIFHYIHKNYPDYPHAYWLPFTCLIVLQVSHKLTLKRIKDRYIGTILGCIIGSLVLLWHPNYPLMITLLFVNLFSFAYYVRKNYKIAVFFVTIFVLILMGYHFQNKSLIILERVGFTLAAGLMVFVSSLIFVKPKNH